ncbi:MAG: aldehyde dehydrogenase family protein [bacterium]|nr:aldehyde dehydrogenase family protein [bacterium]
MKQLLGGKWVDKSQKIEVKNPFNNELIDTVPVATLDDVEKAVEYAETGLKEIGKLSSYERAEILFKIALIIKEDKEKFAKTIASECGKTINEARWEVDRAVQTFTLSAEEAKRIYGETIPYDSVPYGKSKLGFYIRVPVGIVAAITPFNFPLNLVAHKVGPSIAAANATILKPSSLTPLTALILGEVMLEAGLPCEAISVITGTGEQIGDLIVKHPKIRMITFTGSLEIGERIAKLAGLKKLTLELGSNSACCVCADGDIELAVNKIVKGAFAVAGQVCISVQRVFVEGKIWDEFIELLIPKVKALKLGNQLDESTDVGPMITETAAKNVMEWILEAKSMGAKVLCGSKRYGTLFEPTVLIDVYPGAKIYKEEAFAPVVLINKFENFEEAVELVNKTKYGLQAGIFTRDLDKAIEAAKRFEVGGVIINDVPTFRADPMPYGGVKASGIGREGPKFTIEEMTEIRAVCF